MLLCMSAVGCHVICSISASNVCMYNQWINECLHMFVKHVYSCMHVCVASISLVPFVTIWSVAFLLFGSLYSYRQCIKTCGPHGFPFAGCCTPGGGWGVWGLEDKKARKVKIKLLWTNSLFDQAAQRWMDFSAKSRGQLREERCFCFISPCLPFFPLSHCCKLCVLPASLLWRVPGLSFMTPHKHTYAYTMT